MRIADARLEGLETRRKLVEIFGNPFGQHLLDDDFNYQQTRKMLREADREAKATRQDHFAGCLIVRG